MIVISDRDKDALGKKVVLNLGMVSTALESYPCPCIITNYNIRKSTSFHASVFVGLLCCHFPANDLIIVSIFVLWSKKMVGIRIVYQRY